MNLSEQARRTLPIALLGLLLMATGAAVYVMKVFLLDGCSRCHSAHRAEHLHAIDILHGLKSMDSY